MVLYVLDRPTGRATTSVPLLLRDVGGFFLEDFIPIRLSSEFWWGKQVAVADVRDVQRYDVRRPIFTLFGEELTATAQRLQNTKSISNT
jgi:hypothetical protein